MRSKITALGILALAAGLTTVAAQPASAQPIVARHAPAQHASAGDLTIQANAKWHKVGKNTKNKYWKCGKARNAFSSPKIDIQACIIVSRNRLSARGAFIMNEKTYNNYAAEGKAYLSNGGFVTCLGGDGVKGQFVCYGKTMSIKCKKNVYGFGALAIYRQQDHFEHPHQSPKVSGKC